MTFIVMLLSILMVSGTAEAAFPFPPSQPTPDTSSPGPTTPKPDENNSSSNQNSGAGNTDTPSTNPPSANDTNNSANPSSTGWENYLSQLPRPSVGGVLAGTGMLALGTGVLIGGVGVARTLTKITTPTVEALTGIKATTNQFYNPDAVGPMADALRKTNLAMDATTGAMDDIKQQFVSAEVGNTAEALRNIKEATGQLKTTVDHLQGQLEGKQQGTLKDALQDLSSVTKSTKNVADTLHTQLSGANTTGPVAQTLKGLDDTVKSLKTTAQSVEKTTDALTAPIRGPKPLNESVPSQVKQVVHMAMQKLAAGDVAGFQTHLSLETKAIENKYVDPALKQEIQRFEKEKKLSPSMSTERQQQILGAVKEKIRYRQLINDEIQQTLKTQKVHDLPKSTQRKALEVETQKYTARAQAGKEWENSQKGSLLGNLQTMASAFSRDPAAATQTTEAALQNYYKKTKPLSRAAITEKSHLNNLHDQYIRTHHFLLAPAPHKEQVKTLLDGTLSGKKEAKLDTFKQLNATLRTRNTTPGISEGERKLNKETIKLNKQYIRQEQLNLVRRKAVKNLGAEHPVTKDILAEIPQGDKTPRRVHKNIDKILNNHLSTLEGPSLQAAALRKLQQKNERALKRLPSKGKKKK